jgi:hypothetical protein
MRQNRWNDKEAQARVRCRGQSSGRPALALRVYSSRIDRRRSGSGDAWRRQHLGQDRAQGPLRRRCRKCCTSRAAAGISTRSKQPACPGSGSTRCWTCASSTPLSDEDMVNCSAPTCSIPARPIRRSKPCCMHSCRTPLSTTPMPPRFWRWPICPMPKRHPRDLRRPAGRGALHHARLRARQEGGRRLRRPSRCEGLILLKHGHFTFGATARRATTG